MGISTICKTTSYHSMECTSKILYSKHDELTEIGVVEKFVESLIATLLL